MAEFAFISALTLLFVVAALLLVVASHYSLPPIPFYLLAGGVVGLFVDQTLLLDLAQWGIAFLVFAFAVELEPLSGGSLRRDSVFVAGGQAAVTGVVMIAVGLGLGFDPLNALYLSVAATLGSSLVALNLLERRVRLRNLHERMAESIHFVEDLGAILLILLLSAFVYTDGSIQVLVAGFLLLGVALLVRQYAFDWLSTLAGGDVEIMTLTGIALLVGFIALAEVAGVSIVVGAFAAGLAVSTAYPHDVETLDAIGYIEDFFSPIFFVTLGALAAIPTWGSITISAVLIGAIVVLNPLVTIVLIERRGYDSRTAFLSGYSLDQVSEFSLIIAIEALAAGIIVPALFDAIVATAVVTMFSSAIIHRHAPAIYQRLVDAGWFDSAYDAVESNSRVAEGLENHVIITGYDRAGQQVVEACEASGHPYLVIESDPTREQTVEDHCENYVFGDVMSASTWEVARADDAALVVATVARPEWAEAILDLDIAVDTIVRATDPEHGADLLQAGAIFVSVPELLAADHVSEIVGALLDGELTKADLREKGEKRVDRAVEYGPSDVLRIR